MNRFVLCTSIIGLLVVLLVACGQGAAPEPTTHPGKAVMNQKCVQCHDISRVTNYQDDPEGWALTVDRMVMLGAQLSDEQYDQLVDYLATNYPEE